MSFAWHEIHESFMHTTSTLSFQRQFEALRQTEPSLGKFRAPANLLGHLHRHTDDPEAKNQMLRAMVVAAQTDGPVSDCALELTMLALWPGLDAIRSRKRRIWLNGISDLEGELLDRLSFAIRSMDLRRVTRIAAWSQP